MNQQNRGNVIYGGKVEFNRRKNATETYRAILEYSEENGHTPTRQALADSMGISLGAINARLAWVKDIGYWDGLVRFDEKKGQMSLIKNEIDD